MKFFWHNSGTKPFLITQFDFYRVFYKQLLYYWIVNIMKSKPAWIFFIILLDIGQKFQLICVLIFIFTYDNFISKNIIETFIIYCPSWNASKKFREKFTSFLIIGNTKSINFNELINNIENNKKILGKMPIC